MNGQLLDLLSEETGLFISSLRNTQALPRVFKILSRLSPEEYSVEEWNYCLSYLLGHPVCLEGDGQVASFLSDQAGGVIPV